MIVCIDNVLTQEELAHMRGQLLQGDWAHGISAGPQARQVKNNLQLPDDSPALPELRQTVMRALNRSQLLVTAALPFKILPPNFNRYTGETNAYGLHTDSTLRPLPDGSYLRTDVSATLFLSGPEEYEGGELTIEDTYGQQQIKLPAGSMVVYPSGSIHEVRPVTSGERLGCYMFMQSLVKDQEQRRHLFEMDRSLVSLRKRYGEGDSDVVRLTGLYNNLLRRWSEC
ncbi:Fe2+-dependent dioxygenase [Aquisalimonas asiatica]|uniref:PKHD-type hydroxylase n=1 Tax=Aquisalimonas asiatica TaxID=406100 RepID=A0A1H8S5J8_9GAMM|nr:Fe2+-dependent dioxygenase [Aquisalimonas asiatica]SEO73684.1 PKHD-type hydroxylase [Aquisalimonas asiatica]